MAPRGKPTSIGAAVRASMGGLARSRSAPFQARRAEARCRARRVMTPMRWVRYATGA